MGGEGSGGHPSPRRVGDEQHRHVDQPELGQHDVVRVLQVPGGSQPSLAQQVWQAFGMVDLVPPAPVVGEDNDAQGATGASPVARPQVVQASAQPQQVADRRVVVVEVQQPVGGADVGNQDVAVGGEQVVLDLVQLEPGRASRGDVVGGLGDQAAARRVQQLAPGGDVVAVGQGVRPDRAVQRAVEVPDLVAVGRPDAERREQGGEAHMGHGRKRRHQRSRAGPAGERTSPGRLLRGAHRHRVHSQQQRAGRPRARPSTHTPP